MPANDFALTSFDPANMVVETPAHKERLQTQKLKELLGELVQRDPTMTLEHKRLLQEKMREPGLFDRLMMGAGGAALMYTISKFLKMPKEGQMMMSLMGFGIGGILLKAFGASEEKHPNYDPEKKVYVVR